MGRGPLQRLTHVRKDDLISLGLVLLKLNGVELPWYNEVADEHTIEEACDIVLDIWDKYGIEVSFVIIQAIQLITRFFYLEYC